MAFVASLPILSGSRTPHTCTPLESCIRKINHIAPVRVSRIASHAVPRYIAMQETELPPKEDGFEAAEGTSGEPVSHEDNKLFVGNLSWGTTDSSLGAAFEAYGTVIDAKVIFDRFTGKSRGFGFIEYESADSAREALNSMNGILIDGRAIRVDRANRRSPPPPRPRY